MSNLDNLPLMEMAGGQMEVAATPRTPDVLQIKTPTPPPEPVPQEQEEGLAPGMYLQRIEKDAAVSLVTMTLECCCVKCLFWRMVCIRPYHSSNSIVKK